MAGDLMLTSVLSMAALALFFAALLAFADKKLRVEEDPRIKEVYALLPHVNCGACGYVSCHDFAEHIITDGEEPLKCKVLGEEAKERLLKYLGKEEEETFPQIALIHCSAESENKLPVADYTGVRTCRAAALAFGGGMECEYGCIGFGDCVKVCPFGALYMEKGLPRVIQEKCTGCGKCASTCPRQIISIQEKRHEKLYYVACSTHDGALRVRKICGVGCIACRICEKVAPEGTFTVEDNLSRADFSKQGKQKEVSAAAAKCPTKVIKEI
jgi:Na+-translocating ferredoxin:NAD+ oxidoreductase subunit B